LNGPRRCDAEAAGFRSAIRSGLQLNVAGRIGDRVLAGVQEVGLKVAGGVDARVLRDVGFQVADNDRSGRDGEILWIEDGSGDGAASVLSRRRGHAQSGNEEKLEAEAHGASLAAPHCSGITSE
jgi:hypothetical protein